MAAPDPVIESKIAQVPGILEELGLDAWMLFARESAAVHDPSLDLVVASNVTWPSAFILGRRGERIAIVGSLDAASIAACGHYREIVTYVGGIGEELRKVLGRLDPARIAIDFSPDDPAADGLPHGLYLVLLAALEGTPYGGRLESAVKVVAAVRGRKTPVERDRIREACGATVEIFERLTGRLRAGQTERQVASMILEEMGRIGGLEPAWDPDHCPAVFTGPDSAGAHTGPTDRPMEPGHLMNVDFGMKYEGYCSDLQRTWYCLRPGEVAPPEIVAKGFAAVRDAIRKAGEFMRPGVKGVEVDAVARGHITSLGFAEYPHALGHQIGRAAHDGAGLLCPRWERYGTKPDAVVEAGQCYTIEPRVNVPGHGVATMEEIVVVTEDGVRYLSKPQTEIMLVK